MRVQLQSKITCPNCWHGFFTHEALWIASHPDLTGDGRLGPDEQQRFLPTRFSVEGHAIDVKGMKCNHLACPRCHLPICRGLFEIRPLFISILGTPSSGKSYFLASMTWKLRRTLRERFAIGFTDADPTANSMLIEYEQRLFRAADSNKPVAIEKTTLEGDLYHQVTIDGAVVLYPKPFVFAVQPVNGERTDAGPQSQSRLLCMYDNAGENFMLGGDRAVMPGTEHMAHSNVLFFLFDPTQHNEFRAKCRTVSNDPQLGEINWPHQDHASKKSSWPPPQDLVLAEAAARIRRFTGLSQNDKHPRPLIVVVTKCDTWARLIGQGWLDSVRFIKRLEDGLCVLDLSEMECTSGTVRKLLLKYAPELVAAAESFSNEVTYVPVSALGGSPETVSAGGKTGFAVRPKNIRPRFAEVPMLYALHRLAPSLVRVGRQSGS